MGHARNEFEKLYQTKLPAYPPLPPYSMIHFVELSPGFFGKHGLEGKGKGKGKG